MKQKIINSIKHPLIAGSLSLFLGTGLASVFNFLFNVFMTRNLSAADYGILASLMSVLSLALVIASSPVPMLINFGASYFAKNDLAHVRGLFIKASLYYFSVGFCIFLLFIIFPKQIGTFFNIHQIPLVVLCGFAIFVAFVGMVNTALLQAKLSFRYISFTNFVGAIVKLACGIGFFFMGWAVGGAIWAVILGLIAPYILSFYPLKFLFNKGFKTPQFDVKELLRYGVPAAISSFGVTSFISTDIILVKHFFSPELAGIYAGLSLVGRVIFFLTAPIVIVMFPLISQKHAKNENYHGTFLLSLLIVLMPSVAITLFYFIFPVFSMHFFVKQKEYLQAANLLGLFGIFITIYSVLNIFTNFYLSIRKTNIWIPILFAAITQIVSLWFYHQTFLQVIMISLTITSALLLFFAYYYFRIKERDVAKHVSI